MTGAPVTMKRLRAMPEGMLDPVLAASLHRHWYNEEIPVPVLPTDPSAVLIELDCRGLKSAWFGGDATNATNQITIAVDYQVSEGVWFPGAQINVAAGTVATGTASGIAHKCRLRAWCAGGADTLDAVVIGIAQ